MSRIPREAIQTTFLHIMAQGIDKNYIFNKPEDIKYYIKTMYNLQKEFDLTIIAYCIMNNHAHILMHINKIQNLSKYMQILNMKYGSYYNKKYNRVGFVFRNRFKSQGIYNKNHLYNCIKYIYDNPVKAGICKKASEYPYSNYKKINIETNTRYVFLETDDDRINEIKQVIINFCKENKIQKDCLIDDVKKLKKLIEILKDEYNISLRTIASELNIGREKIRNIYNK